VLLYLYFTWNFKKMIIIWPHLHFFAPLPPAVCWAGYGPAAAPKPKVIEFNELNLNILR